MKPDMPGPHGHKDVGDLRAAIDTLTAQILPGPLSLGNAKNVVLRIGDKLYPLLQIGVAVHGGVFVLELVGEDIPPCWYCGMIGAHPDTAVCPSYEYVQRQAADYANRRAA